MELVPEVFPLRIDPLDDIVTEVVPVTVAAFPPEPSAIFPLGADRVYVEPLLFPCNVTVPVVVSLMLTAPAVLALKDVVAVVLNAVPAVPIVPLTADAVRLGADSSPDDPCVIDPVPDAARLIEVVPVTVTRLGIEMEPAVAFVMVKLKLLAWFVPVRTAVPLAVSVTSALVVVPALIVKEAVAFVETLPPL